MQGRPLPSSCTHLHPTLHGGRGGTQHAGAQDLHNMFPGECGNGLGAALKAGEGAVVVDKVEPCQQADMVFAK